MSDKIFHDVFIVWLPAERRPPAGQAVSTAERTRTDLKDISSRRIPNANRQTID